MTIFTRSAGALASSARSAAPMPTISSAHRTTLKCGVCRERFTINVGTIFQDTKLPLRTWFAAIWLITNHPKGIASATLAKHLKITQKSAWFMLHRLRHASRTNSFNAPLKGDVEADATFVGGKEKMNRTSGRLDRRAARTKRLCSGFRARWRASC